LEESRYKERKTERRGARRDKRGRADVGIGGYE
jgi:hypothetical protein